MAATILAIADAVVAELNTARFSRPVVAQRHYQPQFDLSEMTDLKVTVVPRSLVSQPLDRSSHSFDYQIDVAVQQKTDMSQASLDAMMALVEEIADHFRKRPLSNYPSARCVEVKNEPIYLLEHLHELRVFTTVLSVTYRAWR